MNNNKKIVYAACFLLTASGFLLSWWPLAIAGVIIAALLGSYIFALFVGLLLDLAYGAPLGLMHYLFFPCTLTAALSIAARVVGMRYLFQKAPQEHV